MHTPEILSKIGALVLIVAVLMCTDVRADVTQDKQVDESAKMIAKASDKTSPLNYHSLMVLMSSDKPWTYHHRRRSSFRRLDDGTQVWRKPDGTLRIVPPPSLLCCKIPGDLSSCEICGCGQKRQ